MHVPAERREVVFLVDVVLGGADVDVAVLVDGHLYVLELDVFTAGDVHAVDEHAARVGCGSPHSKHHQSRGERRAAFAREPGESL